MRYETISKNFVTSVYLPFSVSHPRMTRDYSPHLSAVLGSSPTLYSAASYLYHLSIIRVYFGITVVTEYPL